MTPALNAATTPSPLGAWIGLAGPTASGKSGLALRLAMHLQIEIISVDSALVYRGMDIGTAKPTMTEREAVPHHLIDILDPAQAYSAAAFVNDAQAAIQAIHARGNVPLLVGGTMLYFHALMRGLDPMPPANPAIRKRLDAEAAVQGWPSMHTRLAQVDAITAARLAPQDSQRIQRALEVWESSGLPLSAWHSRSTRTSAPDAAIASCLITLEPSSRAWLHQRIETRLDTMVAQGFADEVKALRARGDLGVTMPSMRCVGYRQAWEAMDAGKPEGWRDAAVAATRQLAKRQLTWLRSMKGRHIVACDEEPEQVFARVLHVARELTSHHV